MILIPILIISKANHITYTGHKKNKYIYICFNWVLRRSNLALLLLLLLFCCSIPGLHGCAFASQGCVGLNVKEISLCPEGHPGRTNLGGRSGRKCLPLPHFHQWSTLKQPQWSVFLQHWWIGEHFSWWMLDANASSPLELQQNRRLGKLL